MSFIIAYSGAHGVGKTTAVLTRAAELKREMPGKRIGICINNQVFCPYPINQDTTPESQLWIFTHHIQTELLHLSCYDVVVSDRSAVDAIAYTAVAGFYSLADSMLELVRDHMRRYSEINLMTIAGNPHLHNDGLRDSDQDFRQRVDAKLQLLYDELNLTENSPLFRQYVGV